MGRPHIEFVHVTAVEERTCDDTLLAGARERRLSTDDETGAYTSLVAFPAGWTGDLSPSRRPLELFGLRGCMTLAGRSLHEGCYADVPAGVADGALRADTDAVVLVLVEDERPGGGTARVVDTEELRLADHGVEGVPPGLVIKLLRVDEERGDWTWLCAGPPGWQEDRAEIHPTVEEALVLRGDVLLGDRGGMTAGCYFWRPPNVRHGPMFSRNGNLIFFRTKGGGMAVTWEAVPGWQALVDEYRAAEPFFHG